MSSTKTSGYRVITVTALFLILTLLIFQNRSKIPIQICHRTSHSQDNLQIEQTEDEHGIQSKSTTFTQIPVFENMSHENDKIWSSTLTPEQDGFILVQHNETFNLQMGISMFHALHCLSLVREMLQDKFEETSSSGESHSHHGDSESATHFLHETHMPHCLGYIAQSIICAGDSTIEPPWLEKDAAGNIVKQGVDGTGVKHKCRDTSLLWDVAQQSEKQALDAWNWKDGDTVESIFG